MLTCEGLTKSFDKPLFQDLAINLGPGQIMAVLGPSGCGKTTLLRCICGLEKLDQGSILLHGADVTGTPPEDRGIGMIFQEPVLYPHLSVSGNLSLASESGHQAALEEVGLGGFADRSVETLSGGEGQRVALARALLAEPSVLLLDEPFSALDAELSMRLVEDVRRILKERKCPAILVTHNQIEASTFADKVMHMPDLH